MAKAFGGLVRIARLYGESGIWTLTSLAHYRQYSATPVRVDPIVLAMDSEHVVPVLNTTFLNNQTITPAEDNATSVIPANFIVINIGGTVA